MTDEPADDNAAQAASRKSQSDLNRMWSELADTQEAADLAHLPTLLEETENQLEGVRSRVLQLRDVVERLNAAKVPANSMSQLLAILEEAMAAVERFKHEIGSR